jgi:hypothetical protein
MAEPEYVECATPHCPRQLDIVNEEQVMLNLPDAPVLFFCGRPCLAAWAQHYAQTGFRDFVWRGHEVLHG